MYDVDKKSKKKFYNSKEWRMLRRDALIEHPWCCRCGREPSKHVDHCIPFINYDDDLARNEENLYGLCHNCHSEVTTKDEYKYRREYELNNDIEMIKEKKYKLNIIGLDGYPI